MLPSFKNKKFNFNNHDYLLDCDLINKYCLKSIYTKPRFKKIVLHFSLNQLFLSGSTNNNIQVKAFLVFLILFFSSSFINFNNSKLNSTGTNLEFSLKITLSNNIDINLFLLSLFIENLNKLDLSSSKNKQNIQAKSFSYNFSIPGKFFFDGYDFFFHEIKNINFKDLNIKCSFLIENLSPKDKQNVNKVLKNISLFWLN